MIDVSKRSARMGAAAGILAVTGCTMLMNAQFGWSLGSTELEKYTFVIASVSLDLYKVFGLGFVIAALLISRYTKAVAAFLVWAVCVGYGLTAGIGFAAMTRSHSVAERTFHNQKIESVQNDYNNKKLYLDRLTEELATMKNNERYLKSASCTVPEERMREETRIFCSQFGVQKEKIEKAEVDLFMAKGKLPQKDDVYVRDPDPQMTFWSQMTGMDIKTLINRWAIALAVVFEIVSSLGMYAISPSRKKYEYTSTSVRDGIPLKKDGTPMKKRGRPPKLSVVQNS